MAHATLDFAGMCAAEVSAVIVRVAPWLGKDTLDRLFNA